MISFVRSTSDQWRKRLDDKQRTSTLGRRKVSIVPTPMSDSDMTGASIYATDLELSDGRPLDLSFHCSMEGTTLVLSCQTESPVQCKVVLPEVQLAISSAHGRNTLDECKKEVNITAVVDRGLLTISHPKSGDPNEQALSLQVGSLSSCSVDYLIQIWS
jgi:hypothetical protein